MQASISRTRRTIFRIAVLTLLAGSSAAAAEPGGGTVFGKVLDPAGHALANAEVRVAGANLTAVTDLSGSYRLALVPAGGQRLVFSFLGYETAESGVEVAADEQVRLDVTLAYGEVLTVAASPLLTGQAKALNQQKNAVNITNVVAADQMGRFPDPNAAEAAQRISAVTLRRDQGEGRYVLIRGTEARLNSMAINGERIPSPEGGVRDIALDVIPADLLESIEVSKALTPDMDGDAIGGTVNLVTKRAPLSRRLAATVAAGYNEIVEDTIRSGNFTYGERYAGGRLGLLLSGSAFETNRGSDNFEAEYDDGFLDGLELRDYTIQRQRFGLTGALDYQLTGASELFVRGIWSQFDDQELRRRMRNRVGRNAIEREVKDRYESQQITSVTAGGNHLAGRSLLIDYRVAWSQSGETEPDRLDSTFVQEDVEFAPNVTPEAIDPDDIRANPVNEDLGAFELDDLVLEDNLTREEDLVGAVDVTLPFYRDAGFSGYWKTGAKLRFKDKRRDTNVFELDAGDLSLLDLLEAWQSQTPFFNGRYEPGLFHAAAPIRALAGGLERELDLEAELEDYEAAEDSVAVYGMAELQFGELTLLGGLRYEQTESSYLAFELVDGEDVLRPVADDKSYGELLPMLHARFRLDDTSSLRAAVTRTLARANYEDLAPFLFEEDEERVRGNPDLDVTSAWNFDLLYERYLAPAGIFAVGVFYKKLDDNIFTFTFEELDGGVVFDVTRPDNGAGAELLGAEIAFQNRLHTLPPPFDGLGVYFNYTWTDSEADYPVRPSSRLQGQAEQLGNFALSYEKWGFSGRLSLNYHGEFILGVGEEPAADVYVDEHLQLDFAASQQLNARWRVYVELVNLTDEPYRVYEGARDRPIQEELYSWWGTVGLKVDF